MGNPAGSFEPPNPAPSPPGESGGSVLGDKTKQLARLLHTVMYLKPEQIAYRIGYGIRPLRVPPVTTASMIALDTAWPGDVYQPEATTDGVSFSFLGETGCPRPDWSCSQRSKLWLYNLHYLDDLSACTAVDRTAMHADLVNRWIAGNPAATGNGWEPYPLSLRIVNLIKWLSRQRTPQPHWLPSLAQQADALHKQREFHILGNHIFANGKALVFAGCLVDAAGSGSWLHAGLKILDREMGEQFLADGAHFELSPMYHAILTWDLCDLVQLSQWTRHPELHARTEAWRERARKAIAWLRAMVHPDGAVSFFNDAAHGIGPTLAQLEAYADRLGCLPNNGAVVAESGWTATHHLASGYITVDDGAAQHRAILDVARVGPDYQPGHAHADTLSFELSLFGQRLFVNSGTGQYGWSPERQRQRSTSAHNTIEVDGENSSEVWGGFRVARRARPSAISLIPTTDGVRLSAEHNGYLRLPGSVGVRREWSFADRRLEIHDTLSGRYKRAISRLYCHPDIRIRPNSLTELELIGIAGHKVTLTIAGARCVRVVRSTWHPRFGESLANHCIEIELAASDLHATLQWKSV